MGRPGPARCSAAWHVHVTGTTPAGRWGLALAAVQRQSEGKYVCELFGVAAQQR
jgi:hypothetical protein